MRFIKAVRLLFNEHKAVVANKNKRLKSIRVPPAKPRPWSTVYKITIK